MATKTVKIVETAIDDTSVEKIEFTEQLKELLIRNPVLGRSDYSHLSGSRSNARQASSLSTEVRERRNEERRRKIEKKRLQSLLKKERQKMWHEQYKKKKEMMKKISPKGKSKCTQISTSTNVIVSSPPPKKHTSREWPGSENLPESSVKSLENTVSEGSLSSQQEKSYQPAPDTDVEVSTTTAELESLERNVKRKLDFSMSADTPSTSTNDGVTTLETGKSPADSTTGENVTASALGRDTEQVEADSSTENVTPKLKAVRRWAVYDDPVSSEEEGNEYVPVKHSRTSGRIIKPVERRLEKAVVDASMRKHRRRKTKASGMTVGLDQEPKDKDGVILVPNPVLITMEDTLSVTPKKPKKSKSADVLSDAKARKLTDLADTNLSRKTEGKNESPKSAKKPEGKSSKRVKQESQGKAKSVKKYKVDVTFSSTSSNATLVQLSPTEFTDHLTSLHPSSSLSALSAKSDVSTNSLVTSINLEQGALLPNPLHQNLPLTCNNSTPGTSDMNKVTMTETTCINSQQSALNTAAGLLPNFLQPSLPLIPPLYSAQGLSEPGTLQIPSRLNNLFENFSSSSTPNESTSSCAFQNTTLHPSVALPVSVCSESSLNFTSTDTPSTFVLTLPETPTLPSRIRPPPPLVSSASSSSIQKEQQHQQLHQRQQLQLQLTQQHQHGKLHEHHQQQRAQQQKPQTQIDYHQQTPQHHSHGSKTVSRELVHKLLTNLSEGKNKVVQAQAPPAHINPPNIPQTYPGYPPVPPLGTNNTAVSNPSGPGNLRPPPAHRSSQLHTLSRHSLSCNLRTDPSFSQVGGSTGSSGGHGIPQTTPPIRASAAAEQTRFQQSQFATTSLITSSQKLQSHLASTQTNSPMVQRFQSPAPTFPKEQPDHSSRTRPGAIQSHPASPFEQKKLAGQPIPVQPPLYHSVPNAAMLPRQQQQFIRMQRPQNPSGNTNQRLSIPQVLAMQTTPRQQQQQIVNEHMRMMHQSSISNTGTPQLPGSTTKIIPQIIQKRNSGQKLMSNEMATSSNEVWRSGNANNNQFAQQHRQGNQIRLSRKSTNTNKGNMKSTEASVNASQAIHKTVMAILDAASHLSNSQMKRPNTCTSTAVSSSGGRLISQQSYQTHNSHAQLSRSNAGGSLASQILSSASFPRLQRPNLASSLLCQNLTTVPQMSRFPTRTPITAQSGPVNSAPSTAIAHNLVFNLRPSVPGQAKERPYPTSKEGHQPRPRLSSSMCLPVRAGQRQAVPSSGQRPTPSGGSNRMSGNMSVASTRPPLLQNQGPSNMLARPPRPVAPPKPCDMKPSRATLLQALDLRLSSPCVGASQVAQVSAKPSLEQRSIVAAAASKLQEGSKRTASQAFEQPNYAQRVSVDYPLTNAQIKKEYVESQAQSTSQEILPSAPPSNLSRQEHQQISHPASQCTSNRMETTFSSNKEKSQNATVCTTSNSSSNFCGAKSSIVALPEHQRIKQEHYEANKSSDSITSTTSSHTITSTAASSCPVAKTTTNSGNSVPPHVRVKQESYQLLNTPKSTPLSTSSGCLDTSAKTLGGLTTNTFTVVLGSQVSMNPQDLPSHAKIKQEHYSQASSNAISTPSTPSLTMMSISNLIVSHPEKSVGTTQNGTTVATSVRPQLPSHVRIKQEHYSQASNSTSTQLSTATSATVPSTLGGQLISAAELTNNSKQADGISSNMSTLPSHTRIKQELHAKITRALALKTVTSSTASFISPIVTASEQPVSAPNNNTAAAESNVPTPSYHVRIQQENQEGNLAKPSSKTTSMTSLPVSSSIQVTSALLPRGNVEVGGRPNIPLHVRVKQERHEQAGNLVRSNLETSMPSSLPVSTPVQLTTAPLQRGHIENANRPNIPPHVNVKQERNAQAGNISKPNLDSSLPASLPVSVQVASTLLQRGNVGDTERPNIPLHMKVKQERYVSQTSAESEHALPQNSVSTDATVSKQSTLTLPGRKDNQTEPYETQTHRTNSPQNVGVKQDQHFVVHAKKPSPSVELNQAVQTQTSTNSHSAHLLNTDNVRPSEARVNARTSTSQMSTCPKTQQSVTALTVQTHASQVKVKQEMSTAARNEQDDQEASILHLRAVPIKAVIKGKPLLQPNSSMPNLASTISLKAFQKASQENSVETTPQTTSSYHVVVGTNTGRCLSENTPIKKDVDSLASSKATAPTLVTPSTAQSNTGSECQANVVNSSPVKAGYLTTNTTAALDALQTQSTPFTQYQVVIQAGASKPAGLMDPKSMKMEIQAPVVVTTASLSSNTFSGSEAVPVTQYQLMVFNRTDVTSDIVGASPVKQETTPAVTATTSTGNTTTMLSPVSAPNSTPQYQVVVSAPPNVSTEIEPVKKEIVPPSAVATTVPTLLSESPFFVSKIFVSSLGSTRLVKTEVTSENESTTELSKAPTTFTRSNLLAQFATLAGEKKSDSVVTEQPLSVRTNAHNVEYPVGAAPIYQVVVASANASETYNELEIKNDIDGDNSFSSEKMVHVLPGNVLNEIATTVMSDNESFCESALETSLVDLPTVSNSTQLNATPKFSSLLRSPAEATSSKPGTEGVLHDPLYTASIESLALGEQLGYTVSVSLPGVDGNTDEKEVSMGENLIISEIKQEVEVNLPRKLIDLSNDEEDSVSATNSASCTKHQEPIVSQITSQENAIFSASTPNTINMLAADKHFANGPVTEFAQEAENDALFAGQDKNEAVVKLEDEIVVLPSGLRGEIIDISDDEEPSVSNERAGNILTQSDQLSMVRTPLHRGDTTGGHRWATSVDHPVTVNQMATLHKKKTACDTEEAMATVAFIDISDDDNDEDDAGRTRRVDMNTDLEKITLDDVFDTKTDDFGRTIIDEQLQEQTQKSDATIVEIPMCADLSGEQASSVIAKEEEVTVVYPNSSAVIDLCDDENGISNVNKCAFTAGTVDAGQYNIGVGSSEGNSSGTDKRDVVDLNMDARQPSTNSAVVDVDDDDDDDVVMVESLCTGPTTAINSVAKIEGEVEILDQTPMPSTSDQRSRAPSQDRSRAKSSGTGDDAETASLASSECSLKSILATPSKRGNPDVRERRPSSAASSDSSILAEPHSSSALLSSMFSPGRKSRIKDREKTKSARSSTSSSVVPLPSADSPAGRKLADVASWDKEKVAAWLVQHKLDKICLNLMNLDGQGLQRMGFEYWRDADMFFQRIKKVLGISLFQAMVICKGMRELTGVEAGEEEH